MFDRDTDMNLKRTAIALASQLPDDLDAAHRVLDHARALLTDFLGEGAAPAHSSKRPDALVLSLVSRSEGA